jgi:PST family polysaccharide transporter
LRSDFATSSFYSAIATVIKLATLLLMSKIIAVYLGREGLGLIGQLTNFVAIALVLAGGCINVGVVKYVSEYAANDREQLTVFLRTGLIVLLTLSVLSSIFLIIFAPFWSQLILTGPGYADVFVIFGLTILFYGLNTYFISVINGLKQYRLLNLINIITSISGLILSYFLIVNYTIRGAFYAIVTNQSLIFFITWIMVRKKHLIGKVHFRLGVDRTQIRLLGKFIAMTLVSTACVPLIQLILRNYVIGHIGLASAGTWEAMSRISNVHMLFITTTLSTYYLPRLSEITRESEIRHEIFKMLKIIIPLVMLSSFMIFVLRYVVITILFTRNFYDAGSLFGWQLCGDILKTAGWIIGYQMHAKAMARTFILSELLGGLSYLLISILFIRYFGLVGTSMAYAANYFIYLVALLVIFKRTLFVNLKNS